MKRRLYLFLALLMMASLLLYGCDKSLETLADKIEKNMSKTEVVKILGNDYEKYKHDNDEFSLVWISEDKSEVVEVYFDDDREVDDVDFMDDDDWEEREEELEATPTPKPTPEPTPTPVKSPEGSVTFNYFKKTFDSKIKSRASRKGDKIPDNCEFIEEETGKYYANVVYEDVVGLITIYVDSNGYITEGSIECSSNTSIESMVRKKAMESYFKEGFNIPYSDEEINTWYDNGVYKYKETGT